VEALTLEHTRLKDLVRDRPQMEDTIASLRGQLRAMQAQLRESQRLQMTTAQATLEQDRAALEAQVDELSEKLVVATQRAERLQADNAQLSENVRMLTNTQAAADVAMETVQAQNASLLRELGRLQEQMRKKRL